MTTDQRPRLDKDALKQTMATFLAAVQGLGTTPDRLLAHLNVTEETDEMVAAFANGLHHFGLTNVVLIDDSQPPRHSTVPSVDLNVNHVATLGAARARALLDTAAWPFVTIDDPTDRFSPTTFAAAMQQGGFTDSAAASQ